MTVVYAMYLHLAKQTISTSSQTQFYAWLPRPLKWPPTAPASTSSGRVVIAMVTCWQSDEVLGYASVVGVGVDGGGSWAVPSRQEWERAESAWVASAAASRAPVYPLAYSRSVEVVGEAVGIDDVPQNTPLGDVLGWGLHEDVGHGDVDCIAVTFGPDHHLDGAKYTFTSFNWGEEAQVRVPRHKMQDEAS